MKIRYVQDLDALVELPADMNASGRAFEAARSAGKLRVLDEEELDDEQRALLDLARALVADGYEDLVPRAEEIARAAKNDALLWTRTRLATTDASRIDARPRKREEQEERF